MVKSLYKILLITILKLLKLYQCLLSPFLGNCCRFTPSCSQYAQLAIVNCGLIKGAILIVYRLIRCNPWSCGGYDCNLDLKT